MPCSLMYVRPHMKPSSPNHFSSSWTPVLNDFYISPFLIYSTTCPQVLEPFHTAFWNSCSDMSSLTVLRSFLLLAPNELTLLSVNDLLFTQSPELVAVVSCKSFAPLGLEVRVVIFFVSYCLFPPPPPPQQNYHL